MKLKIGDFDVNITAFRHGDLDEDEGTQNFLNMLSIVFSDAAKWNLTRGYIQIPETYEKLSTDIYVALDKLGIYDAYKEEN